MLVLGACVPAWAAMVVISRETFEGVKVLNAANPGNLGIWEAGAWHCRPVGPRLASEVAPGWSGDAQSIITRTRWDLSKPPYQAARSHGMIGCWVRFEELIEAGYYGSGNSANPALVVQLSSGTDNAPFQLIGVTRNGQWVVRGIGGAWTVAEERVREKTWYWVQIKWTTQPSFFQAVASCRQLNGPLVELGSQTVNMADYQATNAYVMNAPAYVLPGQMYVWRGRLGGATLIQIDANEEGGQMPDMLPPVEQRHIWYLDPATGDDSNNGLTPQTAWRTVRKLNQESANSGMLAPLEGGYAQGNELVIDTSVQPLDIGAEALEIRTPGLTMRPPEGGRCIRILAHKDISASRTIWTREGGAGSQVWATTDNGSTDLTDIVIWEDDRWLNHPTGTSAAAVMQALQNQPGSFFSDGTRLYLHPFGSTNPNTDGKTYTRSRFRPNGVSAVMLWAPDLNIQKVDVRKTALVRSFDNDPYTSYGIQGDRGFGGTTLLKNCYVEYAGKHCIGFTDSNSDRDVMVDACQVEQGTPYSSQTPWVDYNGNAEASGNRTTYLNCINRQAAGKIGSIEGNHLEYLSYYAHNNGLGTQFASIRFIGGIYGGQLGTSSGISKLEVENATLGGGTIVAEECQVNRCVMTQLPLSNAHSEGILIARNNLCLFTEGIFNGAFNAIALGTVIYEGNTFDLRSFLRSDNSSFSLFRREGDLAFTFRNNVFLSPLNKNFNVLTKARSSDDLVFSGNVYQAGANQVIVHAYHDGNNTDDRNLTQWQSLGYDANSQFVADAHLSSFYVPEAGSPLIDAGVDLGESEDFSGRFFRRRQSIGAWEPTETFPEWLARQLTEVELADETVSAPEADADGNGNANLFDFASGKDLGQTAQHWKTGMKMADGQLMMELEFQRPRFVSGISWSPELSSNLITWHDGDEVTMQVETAPVWSAWETVRYHLPLKTTGAGRQFIRLRPSITEEVSP